MRYIFVINPTAGKTNSAEFISQEAKKNFKDGEYEPGV